MQPWVATQERPEQVTTVGRVAGSFVALLTQATRRVELPDPPRIHCVRKVFTFGKERIDATLWRLGGGDGVYIVAVPSELFSALGARLREALKAPVLLATVSNGFGCYVPTAEAFAQGGYEVDSALHQDLKPGDGERLIAGIAELAATLDAPPVAAP